MVYKQLNFFKGAAALSIIYFVYIVSFYFNNSYLPAPFVVNKNDTFMDFYNVLHWSLRDGAYTEWYSIYPPLNFLITKVFQLLILDDPSGGSILLRDKIGNKIIYLIITYILCIFISIKISCKDIFTKKIEVLYFIIIVMSAPFLFALERANLIILTVPLLSLYIYSNNRIIKPLMFAILINIKFTKNLINSTTQ